MIRAILYDLDGVLVDAVDLHKRAFNAALLSVSSISLSDEEHLRDFNGLPTKTKLGILVQQGRLDPTLIPYIEKTKQEMTLAGIDAMFKVDNQKTRLHSWTKMSGIKSVCVTNSIRETAELMLKKTAQLKYMSFVVTNQDVASPKPSPEGYWMAMAKLGVKPANTLIIEDSPKGFEAAKKTGAHVMIVNGPNAVNIDSVRSKLIEVSFSSVWSAALS